VHWATFQRKRDSVSPSLFPGDTPCASHHVDVIYSLNDCMFDVMNSFAQIGVLHAVKIASLLTAGSLGPFLIETDS